MPTVSARSTAAPVRGDRRATLARFAVGDRVADASSAESGKLREGRVLEVEWDWRRERYEYRVVWKDKTRSAPEAHLYSARFPRGRGYVLTAFVGPEREIVAIAERPIALCQYRDRLNAPYYNGGGYQVHECAVDGQGLLGLVRRFQPQSA
jgi:hypothetical protein